jgi:tetratricopeptide (TPR) repeat protein
LNRRRADVFLARDIAWAHKKDHDRAITDIGQAIHLDPANAHAFFNRALVWSEEKNYGQAIHDFNDAIRLDPNNPEAYSRRAWIWATCPHVQYRDGKRAVESAMKAVKLNPTAINKDTLAAAHAETGNFDEAVRWQEQALADPQYRDNQDFKRRLELYRNRKPYREE